MADTDVVMVRGRELKSFLPRPPWDHRGFPMPCRWMPLHAILGTPCDGEDARHLLDLLRRERGWIAMVDLPGIGDAGVDHRTLSSVPESDPAVARLCIAAAMWLSEIRATWEMARDGDGVAVVAEEENIIALPAPVSASRVLGQWRERHRVMVVVPSGEGEAKGFLFEAPCDGSEP